MVGITIPAKADLGCVTGIRANETKQINAPNMTWLIVLLSLYVDTNTLEGVSTGK